MATRNISLTDTLDQFVEGRVASGDYQNASEVMRAGLRLLQAQEEAHRAKVARLRGAIQEGLDELDRGQGEAVEDIGAWFAGLNAELDGR